MRYRGLGWFSVEQRGLNRGLSAMADHEEVSDWLIRNGEVGDLLLKEMGTGCAEEVADMVSGSGIRTIYSAIVSSQFDADRLDYMRTEGDHLEDLSKRSVVVSELKTYKAFRVYYADGVGWGQKLGQKK